MELDQGPRRPGAAVEARFGRARGGRMVISTSVECLQRGRRRSTWAGAVADNRQGLVAGGSPPWASRTGEGGHGHSGRPGLGAPRW
ncbi:hypothetical protein [Nonomuraea dietziae]|uniref:hypothetical protein n=1 Tax=Nonomuraea dietziae TaxID=65515 RepID=UPI0031D278CE